MHYHDHCILTIILYVTIMVLQPVHKDLHSNLSPVPTYSIFICARTIKLNSILFQIPFFDPGGPHPLLVSEPCGITAGGETLIVFLTSRHLCPRTKQISGAVRS